MQRILKNLVNHTYLAVAVILRIFHRDESLSLSAFLGKRTVLRWRLFNNYHFFTKREDCHVDLAETRRTAGRIMTFDGFSEKITYPTTVLSKFRYRFLFFLFGSFGDF